MATPPKKKPPKQFDRAEILKMAEPLHVDLFFCNGEQLTPKALPERNGEPSGVDWMKADIDRLQTIAVQAHGPGMYKFVVTDAVGYTHDWQWFFKPQDYPAVPSAGAVAILPSMEEITAIDQENAAIARAERAQVVAAEVATNAAAAAEWGALPVAPQPIAYRGPHHMAIVNPAPPVAFPTAGAAELAETKAKLDAANARAAQLEKKALEEAHRADLERQAAAHERQLEELRAVTAAREEREGANDVTRRFSALEEALAQIAQAVTAKPTGPSPEMLAMQAQVEAMREENRRLNDERMRERERMEAERREAAIEARLEAQRQETAAALQRMEAAMIAASKNTGPDPLFLMMQESNRNTIEMMKENQRRSDDQLKSMQAFSLTPEAIIRMVKEQSNGADELRRTMSGMFEDAMKVNNQITARALELTPAGESTTTRMIEQAVEKVPELMQAYFGNKAAGEASKAKAEIANAQAIAAQANAAQAELNRMAIMEQRARMQQEQAEQAPPTGIPATSALPVAAAPVAVAAPAQPIIVQDLTTPAQAQLRYGHTDEEWFGIALPKVIELRAEVATFLANIQAKPPLTGPNGKLLGASAEDVAHVIAGAIDVANKNNLDIKIIDELFRNERYEKMFAIILPGTPDAFQLHAVTILKAMVDESEEEEDEEDEEDDAPVAAVPMMNGKPIVVVAPPNGVEHGDDAEHEVA